MFKNIPENRIYGRTFGFTADINHSRILTAVHDNRIYKPTLAFTAYYIYHSRVLTVVFNVHKK